MSNIKANSYRSINVISIYPIRVLVSFLQRLRRKLCDALHKASQLPTPRLLLRPARPQRQRRTDMIVPSHGVHGQRPPTLVIVHRHPLPDELVPRDRDVRLRLELAVQHQHLHARAHKVQRLPTRSRLLLRRLQEPHRRIRRHVVQQVRARRVVGVLTRHREGQRHRQHDGAAQPRLVGARGEQFPARRLEPRVQQKRRQVDAARGVAHHEQVQRLRDGRVAQQPVHGARDVFAARGELRPMLEQAVVDDGDGPAEGAREECADVGVDEVLEGREGMRAGAVHEPAAVGEDQGGMAVVRAQGGSRRVVEVEVMARVGAVLVCRAWDGAGGVAVGEQQGSIGLEGGDDDVLQGGPEGW
nr:hypothetical protein CFP56_16743 [Quercus suber]